MRSRSRGQLRILALPRDAAGSRRISGAGKLLVDGISHREIWLGKHFILGATGAWTFDVSHREALKCCTQT